MLSVARLEVGLSSYGFLCCVFIIADKAKARCKKNECDRCSKDLKRSKVCVFIIADKAKARYMKNECDRC